MAQARRVRHVPALVLLQPYLQAFTLAAISLVLLQWPNKSWTLRLVDLLAGSVALALHSIEEPLLASCLALGYLVWMYAPGSYKALNLPSHKSFMRDLKVLERRRDEDKEEGEDCMICWSAESPLAQVVCGHRYCISCLQSMGDHFHTTCPLCIRPLFSIYDRVVFLMSKASAGLGSVNIALLTIKATVEFGRSQYLRLAISLASVSALAFFAGCYLRLMRLYGDKWWRGMPGTDNIVGTLPKTSFGAFISGVGLFAQLYASTDQMLR